MLAPPLADLFAHPATVAFACVGFTQLVKKLGIQGAWLVLVCAGFGGAYGVLLPYLPALPGLVCVLWALAASGHVSLVQDLLSQSGRRPGGDVGTD